MQELTAFCAKIACSLSGMRIKLQPSPHVIKAAVAWREDRGNIRRKQMKGNHPDQVRPPQVYFRA